MSTETTNKKIKIDNGTTFGKTYTDKAVDERLQGLVSTATFTPVKEKADNSLQKPSGLTKTKLVGVGTNGQENIEIGDNLTLANGKLSATGGGSGGESGISVIELTDKNGTIASAQLSEINANPQNFAFKYNGKILLFTSADSTTYQYCNNTTSSSDNNVMTTSTLLTITLSTGAYTIAEDVHNVVANSIHPANGGDLTNIQVGSKVYSIPSGGGGSTIKTTYTEDIFKWDRPSSDRALNVGDIIRTFAKQMDENELPMQLLTSSTITLGTAKFIAVPIQWSLGSIKRAQAVEFVCIVAGTIPANYITNFISVNRVRVVSE